MSSKMVIDREKSARFLSAIALEQSAELVQGAQELLEPYMKEDESFPQEGLELFLQLLGRYMQSQNQKLVEVDAAHEAEKQDDEDLREDRKTQVTALRDRVILVRKTAAAAFPEGQAAKVLGLQGNTSTDASVLLRQALTIQEALTRPGREFPESTNPIVQFDPQTLAEWLKGPMEDLQALLGDLASEARELSASQVAKNAAMQANDTAFLQVAHLLEAWFQLIGNDDMASRVRPSPRRGGQTREQEESEGL